MGSLSAQTEERGCYKEGMQIMSWNGELNFLRNLTIPFLSKAAYKSIRHLPKLTEYINNNINVDSTAPDGGVHIKALLPHLLMLIVLVVVVSRVFHFLLRYFKQPFIICQIIAGIVIFSFVRRPSPSDLLMHVNGVDNYIMLLDPNKRRVEDVIASTGLLFNLFIFGVKMDVATFWHQGKKKSLIIGLSSLLIPLALTLTVSFLLFDQLKPIFLTKNNLYIFFMVYPFCSSYFPGLADILSELGLLNSKLGRLALSCSMVQGLVWWLVLFLSPIIAQGRNERLNGLKALLCILVVVAFIILVIRPYALWIIRNTPHDGPVSNAHLVVIVLAVFAGALFCDLLGTIYTDGPVFMGLTLPNGPPLRNALIERVDMVASELLLPIIFMKEGDNFYWEGLKQNLILWFWVEVIVLFAFVTRMVVTIVAAAYCCDMSIKDGLLLGLIMNFRGLLELLTFIRYVNVKLIDKTTFSILVLSTMSITVVCAPLVAIYYKPLAENKQVGHRTVQGLSTDDELRVMACFYDDKHVPALLDFLEAASPEFSSICIHALQLVELQACASASLISHRSKEGLINTAHMDRAHHRFLTFQQNHRGVVVQPYTSVAPLRTIHQDVCALVLERNIAFVIVPFPKANSIAGLEANTAMCNLVPMVLQEAQCSVGILVYNGIPMLPKRKSSRYNIGVIFWGGPDDREAISIACHMAQHSKVRLDIIRFFASSQSDGCQEEDTAGDITLDDMMISKLQDDNTDNNRVAVSEVRIKNLDELVLAIRNLADRKYNMLIVGRRQMNSSMSICEGLSEWTDSPELGVIGDMLATDFTGTANVLVVHQHG